uniref:Ribosomal protein S2 n=1 Tax=Prasinococcus sp. CCMP1194 TaxID=110672 RepID=A0A650AKI2_9VIRI|nr:ribosomal protein S2 [Prasinococcus sp. CCMP1194]
MYPFSSFSHSSVRILQDFRFFSTSHPIEPSAQGTETQKVPFKKSNKKKDTLHLPSLEGKLPYIQRVKLVELSSHGKGKGHKRVPLVRAPLRPQSDGASSVPFDQSPLFSSLLLHPEKKGEFFSPLFSPVKLRKKGKKKEGEGFLEERVHEKMMSSSAYAKALTHFHHSMEEISMEKESLSPASDSLFVHPVPHVHGGKGDLHPSSYGNTLVFSENTIVLDEEKTQADLLRAAPVFQAFLRTPQKILLYSATHQISYSLGFWAACQWNQSFLAGKWIGGSLTNWTHIVESKKRAAHFQTILQSSIHTQEEGQTPFEDSFSQKRKTGFFQSYKVGPTKPDLLFVFEGSSSLTALKEAHTYGIPTMGFSSGKISSRWLTYPISCNEEDPSVLAFFFFLLATCTGEAKKMFE